MKANSDPEIKVILEHGKPKAISINGTILPNVSDFEYGAPGKLVVTILGEIQFEEGRM